MTGHTRGLHALFVAGRRKTREKNGRWKGLLGGKKPLVVSHTRAACCNHNTLSEAHFSKTAQQTLGRKDRLCRWGWLGSSGREIRRPANAGVGLKIYHRLQECLLHAPRDSLLLEGPATRTVPVRLGDHHMGNRTELRETYSKFPCVSARPRLGLSSEILLKTLKLELLFEV